MQPTHLLALQPIAATYCRINLTLIVFSEAYYLLVSLLSYRPDIVVPMFFLKRLLRVVQPNMLRLCCIFSAGSELFFRYRFLEVKINCDGCRYSVSLAIGAGYQALHSASKYGLKSFLEAPMQRILLNAKLA